MQSPSSRRAWIEIANVPEVGNMCPVALLAEGVDRNLSQLCHDAGLSLVALLAEGVDRNPVEVVKHPCGFWSPSSRRAWIEILRPSNRPAAQPSPSSRRAWIEIFLSASRKQTFRVALLAEGVDRNIFAPFS